MGNRKNSQAHKYGPGSFDLKAKIFSWSAFNVWTAYGQAEFTKKYIYGGADEMNPRMMTGRIVADMLESDKEQVDPTLEHLRVFLPRYQHQEYEIEVPFNGLTLVMHLDGFNEDPMHIGEYKTGVLWTPEKVKKWKQLSWYALGVHLKFKVKPNDVPITLTWMPTEWKMGDRMPRPTGVIENFETIRTTRDCLQIGKEIMDAWKQIEAFCEKEYEAIGL